MGKRIALPLWDRPTYVYRAYSPTGRLLYIGISDNWRTRIEGHRKASIWYRYALRLAVELYENRSLAVAAESWALRYEGPLWNAEPQWRHCPFIRPTPLETFIKKIHPRTRRSND